MTGMPRPSAGLLDRELVAAGLRGRHEEAVRLVLDPLVRAEDPHHPVEAVVVRLDVLVPDRPVVAEAVAAAGLEVPGAEAERDAAPVVRAAAEHPAAEPHELAAGGDGVGLALDVPPAHAAVELAEGPAAVALAAAGRVVVPGEHRPVLAGVPGLAGLEHHDLGPGLGEHLRRHPAARARPHDTHVPRLRRRQDLHAGKLPSRPQRVNRVPGPGPGPCYTSPVSPQRGGAEARRGTGVPTGRPRRGIADLVAHRLRRARRPLRGRRAVRRAVRGAAPAGPAPAGAQGRRSHPRRDHPAPRGLPRHRGA